MQKTLTILGSTGSIGRQTLEVAEHLDMKVLALSAHKNIELLEEQIRKFSPELVAVFDVRAAQELKKRISGKSTGTNNSTKTGTITGTDTNTSTETNAKTGIKTRIVHGMQGQIEAARESGADIIVTAIAGQAGLEPTLAALETGKRVAIANKEPLVCAGEQVMQTAKKHGAEIIPVDSEHSAILQCLMDGRLCLPHPDVSENVRKIILTASGGPFRGMTRDVLESITSEQALKHPNWKMGKKITIDSATLMNKGLELIEAMHLFDIDPDQIEVLIHPESIVHSMVEFSDGSTIAQLSNPDMRQPIQYALTYPHRQPSLTKQLDLTKIKSLTFEKPDLEAFPCLRLAREAAKKGTLACATLNEANEKAVELFLNNKISFNDIPVIIEEALNDLLARDYARSLKL